MVVNEEKNILQARKSLNAELLDVLCHFLFKERFQILLLDFEIVKLLEPPVNQVFLGLCLTVGNKFLPQSHHDFEIQLIILISNIGIDLRYILLMITILNEFDSRFETFDVEVWLHLGFLLVHFNAIQNNIYDIALRR